MERYKAVIRNGCQHNNATYVTFHAFIHEVVCWYNPLCVLIIFINIYILHVIIKWGGQEYVYFANANALLPRRKRYVQCMWMNRWLQVECYRCYSIEVINLLLKMCRVLLEWAINTRIYHSCRLPFSNLAHELSRCANVQERTYDARANRSSWCKQQLQFHE